MRGNENLARIVTNFCTGVGVHDIITSANFYDCRLWGLSVAGVKVWVSPLTCIVALTTLSHYRASVWYRDLKIWFKSHSRSFKLVPFRSLGAVSYSPSTVTTALPCTICEIEPYWSKIVIFPRDAMHKRGLCRRAVSVCHSVCLCVCVRPSRSWILSKRITVSSYFFHHQVDHHSSFSAPNGMAIPPTGTP